MRSDLVEEVIDAARDELFEDVIYTHGLAAPVTIAKAIFGIVPVSERFELLGQPMREATHTTRAIRALFPDLAKGDGLNDGTAYKVLDWEPVGDGRFEILIALKPA